MGSRLQNKSNEVRKRIESHQFADEDGDEYGASKFGGFPEYFRRKKIKLQNKDADRRAQSDRPPIFRGIVAHINGYTQPSLNDLHDLIVAHGGGFIQYLDGKTMVTHIIASNLTPKKTVEFRRYRIVKPAWIVDSVKAGRLLPWNDYRVVDEGAGQKLLGFDNGQIKTQINNRSRGYKEQSDTSWYNAQLRAAEQSPEEPLHDPEQYHDDDHSLAFDGNVSFSISDFDRLERTVAMHDTDNVEAAPSDPNEPDPGIAGNPSPSMSPINVDAMSDQAMLPGDKQDGSADQSPSDEQSPENRGTKRPPVSEPDSPRKVAKLTAEEHNAVLLADPKIRKSTVVNPEFLDQYYRESRLHHLSTWKADLKAKLQSMTAEQSLSQKASAKRVPGSRRYIMHVDFDSFFVAVSLKKCPHLKDKPAVVAHGGGSGSEIASCNYPARTFGVRNGMWMRTAQVMCPDLIVLPYDFPAYEAASREFYEAVLATGGVVQSVSIDEALVDISAECIAASGTDGVRRSEGATDREQAKADQVAQNLRTKVFDATGCNVSVGIGSNILLAKVALRKAKPAGQSQLKPEHVIDFIGALQVQDLPGVAHSLGSKLEEIGIKLVRDIREYTRERLINTLGPKTGEKIWDYARGIDRTEVGDQVIRKSVSAEVNWGVRFENQDQVDEFMNSLCGELQKRLIRERVKGRQLTLKIMRRSPDAPLDPPKHLGHGKCDTFNKSVQLGVATNDARIISKEILATMRSFGFSPGELRGIGIQMQRLEAIKGDGTGDGSQRKLQFKIGRSETSTNQPDQAGDPIQDEEEAVTPTKPTRSRSRAHDLVPAVPAYEAEASPSKKPLNILGTQFALPTQVDPSVLAELPSDIRAKLVPRAQAGLSTADITEQSHKSHAAEPSATSPLTELPSQSQLDAEALAALPSDVRAEMLAFYSNHMPPKTANAQTVLPQSPRKNRILPATANSKRSGRGMTLFRSSKRSLRAADTSTLTQSNFVTRANAQGASGAEGSESEADVGLDTEFLAALPAEVRKEVVQQHRQARLRRAGGIDLSLHQRGRAQRAAKTQASEGFERLFQLPVREARPTFTKRKLSEIGDLRRMVREWVAEFCDEEPFTDDVKALTAYLAAVVTQEGDLAKAVRVVKWLVWTVERECERNWQGDEMKDRWDKVLEQVKKGVQEAVRARGLGDVAF